MTTARRQSREIDGKARAVPDPPAGWKYSIDYCQGANKWQTKLAERTWSTKRAAA